MKKEIIFVSKIYSQELYKSPKAHIDNNPLIITRFNPRSGKRIATATGNNLSKVVSAEHADYYYIIDLSVHEHAQLDPADITAFVLANSHKCLNRIIENHNWNIGYILFDFVMDGVSDNQDKKIKSFF
jgi:hypothetical protein